MFPHATCLCVKSKTESERNVKVQTSQIHRQHYLYNKKQFETNSWIIHQQADFVKIVVLSCSKSSSIQLQQSSQHHSDNNKVSAL